MPYLLRMIRSCKRLARVWRCIWRNRGTLFDDLFAHILVGKFREQAPPMDAAGIGEGVTPSWPGITETSVDVELCRPCRRSA